METVFESERIRYVKVTEELLDDYLTMVNDIERVARWIGRRTEPYTREEELAFVRKKMEETTTMWSMLEKAGGAFIGNIELMDVRDADGELGIAITAARQDKGYGTEAIRRLLDYGFSELELERIWLKAYPYNTRAIHVYERCGFREYDRTKDDVFMEILR